VLPTGDREPGHEAGTGVPDDEDPALREGAPSAGRTAGHGGDDGTGPRTVRAPVLLRPLTVTPRGNGETDYELTLEPTAEINPLLARTLRAHGALLDPVTLARSTFTGAGFDPSDATQRITALGRAVLGDFALTHR